MMLTLQANSDIMKRKSYVAINNSS